MADIDGDMKDRGVLTEYRMQTQAVPSRWFGKQFVALAAGSRDSIKSPGSSGKSNSGMRKADVVGRGPVWTPRRLNGKGKSHHSAGQMAMVLGPPLAEQCAGLEPSSLLSADFSDRPSDQGPSTGNDVPPVCHPPCHINLGGSSRNFKLWINRCKHQAVG